MDIIGRSIQWINYPTIVFSAINYFPFLRNNMVIRISISNFINEERPYFEFMDKFEEMETDHFVDPDEEESTELGEVPHDEVKGSIRTGYNYGPYWQSYTW